MNIVKKAKKLGACKKVLNAQSIDDLVDLFFTPQGIEFCFENNFPSLEDFREAKPEVRNIFIDDVIEKENESVALIHSRGKLIFNNADKLYKVILMHGSVAEIYASNYAVVSVKGDGAKLFIDKTAIVL